LKQYSIPVEVKKLFLTARKSSHIDNPHRVDSQALKRWAMSNRGDYEISVVLKADEASIEEMINARGQKQAILSV